METKQFLRSFELRRGYLWSALTILGVVVLSFILLKNHNEKQFNGKPMSFWVKSLGSRTTEDSIRTWVPFGTNGIPLLIEALLDKGPPIERAYTALNELLPTVIKSKLPAAVQRKAIRFNAANVLADFGSEAKAAVSALITALSEPDVKSNAALALGAIGPFARAAVPRLLEGLDDPTNRLDCLNALSKIGIDSPDAMAKLIALLADGSDDVKRGALAVLGTVASTNAAVDRAFENALRSGSENIRINSMFWAGKRGPAGAPLIPAILDLVWGENGGVNFHDPAIVAFGKFGERGVDALPFLKRMLSATNEFQRVTAAQSIWKIQPGDLDARAVLIASLKSGNSDVRRWSAQFCLARLGEMQEAKASLLELQGDDDEVLRLIGMVTDWLDNTSTPPPIESLLRFLEQEPKRSGNVVYVSDHLLVFDLFQYLGESARDAVQRLTELRTSRKEYIRAGAARALAAIEGRSDRVALNQ